MQVHSPYKQARLDQSQPDRVTHVIFQRRIPRKVFDFHENNTR